jgi:hypothetical protein
MTRIRELASLLLHLQFLLCLRKVRCTRNSIDAIIPRHRRSLRLIRISVGSTFRAITVSTTDSVIVTIVGSRTLVGAGGGASGAVVSCVGLSLSYCRCILRGVGTGLWRWPCNATSSTAGTFFVASALACGVGPSVATALAVAVLDIGAAKGQYRFDGNCNTSAGIVYVEQKFSRLSYFLL